VAAEKRKAGARASKRECSKGVFRVGRNFLAMLLRCYSEKDYDVGAMSDTMRDSIVDTDAARAAGVF
jgi:hypothetical protein